MPEEPAPTLEYVMPTVEPPAEVPTASGGSTLADRLALVGAAGRAMRPRLADGSRPPPQQPWVVPLRSRPWVVLRARNLDAEGVDRRRSGGDSEAHGGFCKPVVRIYPLQARATEFMQCVDRVVPDQRR